MTIWRGTTRNLKTFKKTNKLAAICAELVRQYCRVFDTSDYKDSFLRSWALLERLTDASGDYERLVRRASKVWKEEDIFREIAQYLRDRRNRFTHSSASEERGEEDLVYLSKTLIEPLMSLFLVNSFKFSEVGELVSFLDLPSSKTELLKRKSLIEKGIKFRR